MTTPANQLYVNTAPTFVVDPTIKYVGYLYILPDFCIASRGPKPKQEHLDAMREQFGWEWKDL